jgi:hypothetical protein
MGETGANELLEAVQAFLRNEVLPRLEGFAAYNTRVAANSLAIVARELQLRPELERLDQAMARQLGIDPAAGSVPQQIARQLRSRQMQPEPDLLRYLRQRTLQTLAIDNPRYSGYLQALERWPDDRA